MAEKNLSPRMKMISMMYLVLTALLAMNVSKDILDAFVIINEGIEKTNLNFENKNETTYNAFDKAKQIDPIKVTHYWQKAMLAKKLADELDDHIDNLKRYLIQTTEKLEDAAADTTTLRYVDAKDNYDEPTRIMIGDPATPWPSSQAWSAGELKEKIVLYHDDLLNLIEDDLVRSSMNIGLDTKDIGDVNGTYETWATGIFYHVPLAAVVTALTKIQSDVRNAESDIIKQLYSNISADDFKFDTLAAKVIPNSRYVFLGDTFRAEVMVAAFSTTQDPVLEVGFELDSVGQAINPDTAGVSVSRGVAIYTFVPKSEGQFEWGGVIKIKKPDGTPAPYKFKSDFMVAKPQLVVSPTAMNVFYRGLENPVSISAPGVSMEDLRVSMSNGSIIPKNKAHGEYVVKPGKGREANINVSIEINGKTRRLGDAKFRIKDVPPPTPYFAGVTGTGKVSTAKLKAARGVLAKMENFQFDLKYTVTQFTMSMMYKGSLVEQKSRNNKVTADMLKMMKAAKRGTKMYIEDIKATGPGGKKSLGGISVKVL